jgi:hypothetical protein
MRIICLTLLGLGLLTTRAAVAQPAASPPVEGNTSATLAGATHGTGLGVGVAAMLAGPVGLSVAYDAGPWHLDSMLGITKEDGPDPADRRPSIDLGGRFWFHLHKSANSDFSIGAGLGYEHHGPSTADVLSLEGGALVRAFIASNVALSFSVGLGIQTVDVSRVVLGGQFIGGAAVHYFFY